MVFKNTSSPISQGKIRSYDLKKRYNEIIENTIHQLDHSMKVSDTNHVF